MNIESLFVEPQNKPFAEMSAEEMVVDWITRVAVDTKIDQLVATDATKREVEVAEGMYEPSPSMLGRTVDEMQTLLHEHAVRSSRYYAEVIRPLYDGDPNVMRKNLLLGWYLQSLETEEEGSNKLAINLLVPLRMAAETVTNSSFEGDEALQLVIRNQFLALWATRNTP